MQRLMSLAMLAVLLGGGYTALNALLPSNVRQVVDRAGVVLQQGAGTQAGYAGYDRSAPGYAPAPATPASVIRIASYNIQVFGNAKASDANVMRTLAAVVQQFDIVAIQEIRTTDQDFIDKFLAGYVNASGRRYSRVVGPRLGRSNSKEQYAFLFDTATIQVNPNYIHTVSDPHDLLHRPPLLAMFATRAPANPFTFILVNCHTDPDETKTELDELARAIGNIRRHASTYLSPAEDDVILLGDLNTAVRVSPTRQLRPNDLRGLGRITGIYPVIRTTPTNTARTRLHDNLLVNRLSTTEFTGNSGVYDLEAQFGLTREQAQMVSDHLPVWAEFSVVEGGTPGRLAIAPSLQPSVPR